MTDLMHYRVLEIGQNEGLGFRTGGVEFAARFQQVERKIELLRRVLRLQTVHIGVLEEPRKRGHVGKLFDPLEASIAQPYRVDANVGIEDFAAARIDLSRPDAAKQRSRRRHPTN